MRNSDRIDGVDGWSIVDCGIANDPTRAAWETVFANELEGLPVLRVIVTHMHPDHIGNAHWLTERWGCRLWISATDWNAARLSSQSTTGFGGDSAAVVGHGHRIPARHRHVLLGPVFQRVTRGPDLGGGGQFHVPPGQHQDGLIDIEYRANADDAVGGGENAHVAEGFHLVDFVPTGVGLPRDAGAARLAQSALLSDRAMGYEIAGRVPLETISEAPDGTSFTALMERYDARLLVCAPGDDPFQMPRRRIADLVLALLPHDPTLQIGFGGIPEALVRSLPSASTPRIVPPSRRRLSSRNRSSGTTSRNGWVLPSDRSMPPRALPVDHPRPWKRW